MTYLSHLDCPKCHRTYPANVPQNLCQCGAPLLARYDLAALARSVVRDELERREASMWRYREFLPIGDPSHIISLGEGWTPMLRLVTVGAEMGLPHLYVKDEGLNPTGTFKARGAAAGISRARELDIAEVAMPTAGNAGGAWAAYGARAGIRVHVAMPADAPDITKTECRAYGASLTLVDGLISDAGRVIAEGVRQHGWFDVSTLKEPYRIEGKKTLGLEIAEQFGWRLPDVIIYPAGGGVGIIGIWKAIGELRDIGWVTDPAPRLMVVQADGCAPIVRAFQQGTDESEFWQGAQTIAAGLRVPKALGDFLVLRAVRETGGVAVSVSDEEIRRAVRTLAQQEGIFACPEGAATLAAVARLKDQNVISAEDKVVLINTGSGLKYPDLVRA